MTKAPREDGGISETVGGTYPNTITDISRSTAQQAGSVVDNSAEAVTGLFSKEEKIEQINKSFAKIQPESGAAKLTKEYTQNILLKWQIQDFKSQFPDDDRYDHIDLENIQVSDNPEKKEGE